MPAVAGSASNCTLSPTFTCFSIAGSCTRKTIVMLSSSISRLLIGPLVSVILLAPVSIFLTTPGTIVSWADATDEAKMESARVAAASLLMFIFLFPFVRFGLVRVMVSILHALHAFHSLHLGRFDRLFWLALARCIGRWRIDLVGDRALRKLVGTGVLVIVARKPFAYLHDGEHPTHFDRTELSRAAHHHQRVFGHRPLHFAHVPTGQPHCHRIRRKLADRLGEILLRNADKVLNVVAHRIHGVRRLIAMKCPVSRIVRCEVEGTDCAHGYISGHFRPLRAFGDPSAVRATDGELVTVQMNRMVGHC